MNKFSKIILGLLSASAALAAVYYVALFLYVSISRIGFPLTFDWVEGATLVQANRILLGQKLYLEPNPAYIPLVYQPLYFYLAAAFIKLLGLGLMPIRLISVLSTCGCILTIFLMTKKISGAWFAAIIAAGLFAATNQLVRMWFDLARVDMLCIFFFMAGLYFVLHENPRSSVLAGVLFALSFFTKQSTAPIILLIFAYYFFVKRKQALIFMLVFGLLLGAGTLALTYESNGLYLFYIYRLPAYHRMYTELSYLWIVTVNLMQPILIVLSIIVLGVLLNFKKMLRNHNECLLLIITIATLALSIWAGLITGSTRNAFIPAYALIAVLFGLALNHLKNNSAAFLGGKFKIMGGILLLGGCLLQFSFLQYHANVYIPTAQDFKQADALLTFVGANDEEAFMPTQNYLALYTQKKVYYHGAAIGEFNGAFGRPLPQWATLRKDIVKTIHKKEVSFVYLETPRQMWLGTTCTSVDVFTSNSRFIKSLYKMSCH